jgi:hypothetical protein
MLGHAEPCTARPRHRCRFHIRKVWEFRTSELDDPKAFTTPSGENQAVVDHGHRKLELDPGESGQAVRRLRLDAHRDSFWAIG